jgi:hypothetical protein
MRRGRKCVVRTNVLAYNAAKLITAIKCFIVRALEFKLKMKKFDENYFLSNLVETSFNNSYSFSQSYHFIGDVKVIKVPQCQSYKTF